MQKFWVIVHVADVPFYVILRLKPLQPFEPEDFANPFSESDSYALRARTKLGTFEIFNGWLGWGFAK